ncbi:transcriptional regulator [Salmonella enterica subsp. enterica serovar Enteritidis]|nr:transcriptional regulator [Salmonella enterica subsp. enterica serovar Enteritidis]
MTERLSRRTTRFRRTVIPGTLESGAVNIHYFQLLITVCLIRKKNVSDALEDVLVRGFSRREACECNGISQSTLSVRLRHLQMVSHTVVRMYPYIKEQISDIEQ